MISKGVLSPAKIKDEKNKTQKKSEKWYTKIGGRGIRGEKKKKEGLSCMEYASLLV